MSEFLAIRCSQGFHKKGFFDETINRRAIYEWVKNQRRALAIFVRPLRRHNPLSRLLASDILIDILSRSERHFIRESPLLLLFRWKKPTEEDFLLCCVKMLCESHNGNKPWSCDNRIGQRQSGGSWPHSRPINVLVGVGFVRWREVVASESVKMLCKNYPHPRIERERYPLRDSLGFSNCTDKKLTTFWIPSPHPEIRLIYMDFERSTSGNFS